jgi:hypothetical protein
MAGLFEAAPFFSHPVTSACMLGGNVRRVPRVRGVGSGTFVPFGAPGPRAMSFRTAKYSQEESMKTVIVGLAVAALLVFQA